MDTIGAVRTRILRLCEARGMSINRLHGMRAAAVKHQEHSIRQKSEPEAAHDKDALRRA